MKKFKQTDVLISGVLIIASLGWAFTTYDDRFFVGYFVVGGWQVISMLVHAFMGWFSERGSKRFNYQVTVLVIIIIALLGFVVYPLLIIYFPLLFLSPFMALWYTWLCYNETYVKMQRPMALLK